MQKIEVLNHWREKLQAYLPGFFDQHPVLSKFYQGATVFLHGSTTRGVDDRGSDLDLWLLQSDSDLAALDAASDTRFFEIELDGKPGHLNAESLSSFSQRLERCDMHLIAELRQAVILADHTGKARELLDMARRSMRDEVRRAFFFYHYVEMRGDHRSCDNPMERGHSFAVLASLAKTLAHALRAVMVLDGEPYPYEKWLHQTAVLTPTGSLLAPHVDQILNHLAADCLRLIGPEPANPISQTLRQIRQLLIDAARDRGIDEPWLEKWWLHINQARDVVTTVRW